MDKKFKLSYEPPKLTAVAFKVENAMASPLGAPILSDFNIGQSWDGESSSSSTNPFGNNSWMGDGSSNGTSDFTPNRWD